MTRKKRKQSGRPDGSDKSKPECAYGSEKQIDNFPSTSSCKNYEPVPRRQGTQSKGQEYEREVLLYMSAHLSQNSNTKNFRIVSNAKDLGVWDDVVARISFVEEKNDIVVFVQSKHLESDDKVLWFHLDSCKHPCPEKKYEKINLTCYREDFQNLIKKKVNKKNVKEDINIDMCKLLGDIDEKDYFACIFTNTRVHYCSECIKITLESKILNKDHPLYFLDTSGTPVPMSKGHYQQYNFETITEEDERCFYRQLFIFSNQQSHKCLPIVDQLGLDFKTVLLYLDERIQDFMEKKNGNGVTICQPLTKEEFEIKCLEVVLIHNNWWRYDFPKTPRNQISHKFKELWRTVLSQKNIINLVDEGIEGIRLLLTDYYQCIVNDNYKEGMQTSDLLLSLWHEQKIPLSIKPEYTSNIFHLLKRFKTLPKSFIVFCDEDFPELIEYKLTESVITYVNEIPDIEQIIPEILKVEVSLQGRNLVPLSKIVEKSAVGDKIYSKLPMYQLLIWTMNIKTEQTRKIQQTHCIGPELIKPDENYIKRTFTPNVEDKYGDDSTHNKKQKPLTEEDVLDLARPGVNIITGDPGMGKSTVLQALAHSYSPQNFVIYIKLRDCLHDIEDEDKWPNIQADPIQYFYNKMSGKVDIIAKTIMESHKTGNRMCIFLDAYDEILPLHGQRISLLMERILKSNDIPIFCTTRPHAEEMITKRASAICLELTPLTDKQIAKYLSGQEYFIIRSQFDRQFLSNPLHLSMILEIYGKENSGKITKADMYRMFIESKLMKKSFTKNDAYVLNRKIMKNHRILAMTIIFGEECLISKKVITDDELDTILDEIRDQNIGIVEVPVTSRNFQFVHRTFAEYLVVEWMLCKEDQDISNRKYLKYFFKKVMINSLYWNIRNLLILHNIDLWCTARKYLLINCINEDCSLTEQVTDQYIEFDNWLKSTDAHRNVNSSALVGVINNDYPTSKPLTENHADSCTKLLRAIHAEYKPHIELVLNAYPTLLETGLGIVAFNLAITTGNENIVNLLLQSRSTLIDEQDVDGNTGLHIACGCGFKPIAAMLLKNGANISIGNKSGMTPLGMATAYDKLEIWKIEDFLFNQRSAVNSPSSNDINKALLKASQTDEWDVVELLLERGADPEVSDDNGWTVMHFAADEGESQIVEMLSVKGLDVNVKTNDGKTPLAIACEDWDSDTIKCLLQHGADPEVSNVYDWPLIHFAAMQGELQLIEMLLAMGLDVNVRTNAGETPLALACEAWDTDTVECLLQHGADPKISNNDGWTVMHFAAEEGELRIIEMLLAMGLDVNVRTNKGETPLAIACKGWDTDTVKCLLEHGADPKVSNDAGWTVMHFAAEQEELHIIEMSLAMGLDVNVRTNEGETPLAIACEAWDTDTVKCLLQHGADPKVPNDDGWTVMHFAAKEGELQIIEMSLAMGPDVNQRTKEGDTPLTIACEEGNWDIVKRLLEHGADPKISNNDGWTVMHFAAEQGELHIIEKSLATGLDVNVRTNEGETPLAIAYEEWDSDTVKCLLQHGADPKVPNDDGWTVMHLAAKEGELQIIEMSLAMGPDVNLRTKEGDTPLTIACEEGNWDIVKRLLEHGADPKISNVDGWTVIHYAALSGELQIIKMISARGLDINQRTNKGDTPLAIATKERNRDIVQWLVNHGADH